MSREDPATFEKAIKCFESATLAEKRSCFVVIRVLRGSIFIKQKLRSNEVTCEF